MLGSRICPAFTCQRGTRRVPESSCNSAFVETTHIERQLTGCSALHEQNPFPLWMTRPGHVIGSELWASWSMSLWFQSSWSRGVSASSFQKGNIGYPSTGTQFLCHVNHYHLRAQPDDPLQVLSHPTIWMKTGNETQPITRWLIRAGQWIYS